MGYCIEQRSADFRIKRSNFAGALKAIKGLADREHYSWVSASEFARAESLPEAMEAWRWSVTVKDDDVTDIFFEGEKSGDDDTLLDAIAPFVEPGCYIEMQGEDGTLWRWVFDGKTCKEKGATVSWD
jgi:hypothetical protein